MTRRAQQAHQTACICSPVQVQKVLAKVASRISSGDHFYTRFFAIGLFRLLELTDAKDPKALESLVKVRRAAARAVGAGLCGHNPRASVTQRRPLRCTAPPLSSNPALLPGARCVACCLLQPPFFPAPVELPNVVATVCVAGSRDTIGDMPLTRARAPSPARWMERKLAHLRWAWDTS